MSRINFRHETAETHLVACEIERVAIDPVGFDVVLLNQAPEISDGLG